MFRVSLAHHQGVKSCTNQSLKLFFPSPVCALPDERVSALAGLHINKSIIMHGMKSVKYYYTSKLNMAVKWPLNLIRMDKS
jgi:hypothetical protein